MLADQARRPAGRKLNPGRRVGANAGVNRSGVEGKLSLLLTCRLIAGLPRSLENPP